MLVKKFHSSSVLRFLIKVFMLYPVLSGMIRAGTGNDPVSSDPSAARRTEVQDPVTSYRVPEERAVLPLVPVATWGGYGSKESELKDPQGISTDPSGALYISDTGNQRVQKWNSRGDFISLVGGFGWGKEHFNIPMGLSARNGLDVLIADFSNHRIERYDKDLNYLATLVSTSEWPDNLRFGFPRDTDISLQGELFCVDGENNRVLKLDVLGNPQISFGDYDSGEGRLGSPHAVLCSSSGRIFVSDIRQGSIMVYDSYGNFLLEIGRDRLESPMGITETASMILIADGSKKSLFAFTENGKYVGEYPSTEAGPVSFKEPVDVAVYRDRVFVLDRKQSAVFLFRYADPEGLRIP